MTESLPIEPAGAPLVGSLRPPGSKSITNRSLLLAALAEGTSELTGVLDSDDTRVMVESLRRLGIQVDQSAEKATARIHGGRGRFPRAWAELDLVNSGTSIRFLTAACAACGGDYRLDGNERMRARPIQALIEAILELGGDAWCERGTGCPPVRISGNGFTGGEVAIAGGTSSQYLSALLMAAPLAGDSIQLRPEGEQVSLPYVEMTREVMRAFGVSAVPSGKAFRIEPAAYRAADYQIEPDASAASYWFAAAAITGGAVQVDGLTRQAIQGDVRFVDVLEKMGCRLEEGPDWLRVRGGPLGGVTVDMNAISDTAQTLAAVAPFAEGPTTITGIDHVRHKETDRIAALATELRRAGQTVEERDDGLTIHPRPIRPARIATYDDHRMAMSFAILGLGAAGITIADPACTTKTYPRFWEDLARLRGFRV